MPDELATKTGHGLAKALGIQIPYRDPLNANEDPVTRGESTFSAGTMDTFSYLEPEPTTWDWIKEHTPSWREVGFYFYRLFPFLTWITRYNRKWLIGDLVAGMVHSIIFTFRLYKAMSYDSNSCVLGITVGCVVIPQGMAYAKLANLPVEFGLYSSFMGVLIYWFFATSKDITIGVRISLARVKAFNLVLADLYPSRSLSCPPSLVPLCRNPRPNSPTLKVMLSLQPWPSYAAQLFAFWAWLVWVLLSILFLCRPFRLS